MNSRREMARRLCIFLHGSGHASGGVVPFCNIAWRAVIAITTEEKKSDE